jgi:peptidyl-prolyl cis-trans isomerase SurA
MFKKSILFYVIIFCLLIKNSIAEVYIVAKVNEEIITNISIKKELNYLQLLNPNFKSLDEKQKFKIVKASLIDEIVKKKEIQKFIKIEVENPLLDGFIKNFYTRLNYSNLEEFKNALSLEETYSFEDFKSKINIELLWNELIFSRYKNQIKIDKENLIQKIKFMANENSIDYNISEIIFIKKKDKTINELINEIELSISEIGFNNTATLYSISESSKFGGKIGWVNKNNLSEEILIELEKIKKGERTKIISIGNRYLILKIDDIKTTKKIINEEDELNKLIQAETNRQLNQFSKIYFDKSKINYLINEYK